MTHEEDQKEREENSDDAHEEEADGAVSERLDDSEKADTGGYGRPLPSDSLKLQLPVTPSTTRTSLRYSIDH